jgi:ribose/xylose/arabinose/galactoside ABC-type transport system permease subunit
MSGDGMAEMTADSPRKPVVDYAAPGVPERRGSTLAAVSCLILGMFSLVALIVLRVSHTDLSRGSLVLLASLPIVGIILSRMGPWIGAVRVMALFGKLFCYVCIVAYVPDILKTILSFVFRC